MTFLSKGNLPQSGGQGRPDAPEDLLRAMVQGLVQETIQAEFDQFIGAGHFKRSDTRRGWRNGFKPRTFKTRVGKLVLRIPQDREKQSELLILVRSGCGGAGGAGSGCACLLAATRTRRVGAAR